MSIYSDLFNLVECNWFTLNTFWKNSCSAMNMYLRDCIRHLDNYGVLFEICFIRRFVNIQITFLNGSQTMHTMITYIHLSLRIWGCCDSMLQCNWTYLGIFPTYSWHAMTVYPDKFRWFTEVKISWEITITLLPSGNIFNAQKCLYTFSPNVLLAMNIYYYILNRIECN